MPIALMAGVLDPVDPAKLAKAPIQGFLKKPIELRELGDRVKALLATPVVVAEPSPFSTVPATLAQDLMQRPGKDLPELRPEPEPEPVVEADAPLAFDEDFLTVEEDLLVLDAGDLWPEEAPAPTVEPAVEALAESSPVLPASDVQLELEELDFDSLQNLTDEPLPSFEPIPGQPAFVPPVELMTQGPVTGTLPEPFLEAEPTSRDKGVDEIDLTAMAGLEELDAFPSDFELPEPPAQVPLSTMEPVADDHDLFIAASLAAVAGTGYAVHALAEPAPEHPAPQPQAEASPAPPAASGQAPAAPGQAASSEQAQVLVQALLADPVLMDALVKALVARMGDQVLREIAWEVMPDLAGRLQP